MSSTRNQPPNTSGMAAAPRCSRRSKRTGGPCKAPALRGSNPLTCAVHAGKSKATVRAEVAVREEVAQWGLGDSTVDPGVLLMRLVTQAAIRADMYAVELARIVAEQDGDLRKALTGNTYTVTAEGDPVKTGEYVRAMTKLEGEERDRAANFAARAVAAGLAERQARLLEQQAALAAKFVHAVLSDLGMAGTPAAQDAIRRHLVLLAPAA